MKGLAVFDGCGGCPYMRSAAGSVAQGGGCPKVKSLGGLHWRAAPPSFLLGRAAVSLLRLGFRNVLV